MLQILEAIVAKRVGKSQHEQPESEKAGFVRCLSTIMLGLDVGQELELTREVPNLR